MDKNGYKKLYKAHKQWLAAGVAAAALLTMQGMGSQTVSADTMPGIPVTVEQGDTATPIQKAAAEATQQAKAEFQAEHMGRATEPDFAGPLHRTIKMTGRNSAFLDGQKVGESGAAMPDLSAHTAFYKISFDEGYSAGAAAYKLKVERTAYADGERTGETGATLPDLSGKSAAYLVSFARGLAAGKQTYAQKLAAQKDEANQAFAAGQRYGETGAVLPDLSQQTANYKLNFAKGFDAGAATRAQQLAAQQAKAKAAALAEANQAFRDGQRYGETGAVLPNMADKSSNYKTAFAQGFNAGAATLAQKLTAQRAKAHALAEQQAAHMGQATVPSQATIAAQSQRAEANQAFRDGQRYGETGATLPNLAGKSANYQTNFAQGFNAGAGARQALLTALAAKRQAHGDAILALHQQGADFRTAKRLDAAYAKGLAAGKKAAAAAGVATEGTTPGTSGEPTEGVEPGPGVEPTQGGEPTEGVTPGQGEPGTAPVKTLQPGNDTAQPSVKLKAGSHKQAGVKVLSTNHSMPATGEATEPGVAAVGAFAVLGALLGLAGRAFRKQA